VIFHSRQNLDYLIFAVLQATF